MEIAIKIIGMVFALAGIVWVLKPEVLKRVMEFFQKGKRLYLVAVVRLVLAVVFLVAARECDVPWLIFALGIVLLISGLLTFVLGPERLKPILGWWQKRSCLLIRILGLFALAVGVAVIYSA